MIRRSTLAVLACGPLLLGVFGCRVENPQSSGSPEPGSHSSETSAGENSPSETGASTPAESDSASSAPTMSPNSQAPNSQASNSQAATTPAPATTTKPSAPATAPQNTTGTPATTPATARPTAAKQPPPTHPLGMITYVYECSENTTPVQPRTLTLRCTGNRPTLDGLWWKGWGGASAVAAGDMRVKQRRYPVGVSATRLVHKEASQVYSLVNVRFTGAVPPGHKRIETFRLPTGNR